MNQEISVIISAQMQEFNRAMREVSRSAQQAGDQAERAFGDMERDAGKSSKGIGSVFKGLGGVIAGVFASIGVASFFKDIVSEAANLEAMQAQFETAFGSAQPEARKMVDAISKEMNVVPQRLDPIMASVTSKFKGLGFDVEEAMSLADRSTRLAADGAAFYDKTLEDANGSLQSWLMGNTDAGDAVGLYASQTEIANWVLKEHGVAMDDLTESQKQAMRLNYAESVYENAEITGQAARESESLSNVLENLKSSWKTLMGQMGTNLLPYVTSTVQWLSDKLQSVDFGAIRDKFKVFMDYMSTTFAPLVEAVKGKFDELMEIFKNTGVIDGAKGALEGIQTGFQWFVDNLPGAIEAVAGFIDSFKLEDAIQSVKDFTEKYEYLLVFVGSAAGIYLAATGAIAIYNGVLAAGAAIANAARLAYIGVAIALMGISWPIVLIIAAIALLITAIYAIWKNWDSVSAWLSESWTWIKDQATSIFGSIGEFFSGVWETIKATISAVWNGIKTFLSNSWNSIKEFAVGVFTGLVTYFTTVFNIYKAIITAVWNGIKAFLSAIWNGIKAVASTIFNGLKTLITTVFNGMKNAITTVWNAVKSFLSSAWNGIKSTASNVFNGMKTLITTVFNGMKTSITNVWNTIKSTLSNTWNSIKSTATSTFNAVKTAITRPIETAKNTIKRAIDAIKGFFSGMKLKFPKISMPKLPKFSLTGKFSLMPPSVPKVGINWYATGGIATGPSVVGIGEAGDEAILPLSNKSKMRPFANAVSSMLDTDGGGSGQTIINNYTINATIREEADVDKLSRAIVDKQEKLDRAGGRR